MILKGKERIRLLGVVLSVILLFTVNATAFADGSANNENTQNIYDRIDDYLSNTVPKTHNGWRKNYYSSVV